MGKTCVFCGKQPQTKTLEHIIPLWLINLTGDSNRSAYFGYKNIDGEEVKKRIFSFDSFKFPACQDCNNQFSELENNIKNIILKMLQEQALAQDDINLLLDWFDKVRIGLWLGMRSLDDNQYGVNPRFYIKQRIRKHDRVLVIYKIEDLQKKLCFGGCDTPFFGITPSCFSLIINNLVFFNMSYPSLLVRRIGFPFPGKSFQHENGIIESELIFGRERIMTPILKKVFDIGGSEFYQPIFTGNLNANTEKSIYDTKYVRDRCIDWDEGLGKIFMKNNSNVCLYPEQQSMNWIPSLNKENKFIFDTQIITLEWQLYILGLAPSLEFLPKNIKYNYINNISLSNRYNKQLIDVLLKKRKKLDGIQFIWKSNKSRTENKK